MEEKWTMLSMHPSRRPTGKTWLSVQSCSVKKGFFGSFVLFWKGGGDIKGEGGGVGFRAMRNPNMVHC